MTIASVVAGVTLLAYGSEGGLTLLVFCGPMFGCIFLFYWSAYREAAQIARYGLLVTDAFVTPTHMRLRSQDLPVYFVQVAEAGQWKTASIVAPGPVASRVFVFSIPGPRTRLAVFVPTQGLTAQLAR